jgi:hypothetical protein
MLSRSLSVPRKWARGAFVCAIAASAALFLSCGNLDDDWERDFAGQERSSPQSPQGACEPRVHARNVPWPSGNRVHDERAILALYQASVRATTEQTDTKAHNLTDDERRALLTTTNALDRLYTAGLAQVMERCATMFLFGAAVGLTEWLDRAYPSSLDTQTKADSLRKLFRVLQSAGRWNYSVTQTEQGWPLFMGEIGEFIYLDADKRMIRGKVPTPERDAIMLGHVSWRAPTRLDSEAAKARGLRVLDAVVTPDHPYFEASTLVDYIFEHVLASKIAERAGGYRPTCGTSPFLTEANP